MTNGFNASSYSNYFFSEVHSDNFDEQNNDNNEFRSMDDNGDDDALSILANSKLYQDDEHIISSQEVIYNQQRHGVANSNWGLGVFPSSGALDDMEGIDDDDDDDFESDDDNEGGEGDGQNSMLSNASIRRPKGLINARAGKRNDASDPSSSSSSLSIGPPFHRGKVWTQLEQFAGIPSSWLDGDHANVPNSPHTTSKAQSFCDQVHLLSRYHDSGSLKRSLCPSRGHV